MLLNRVSSISEVTVCSLASLLTSKMLVAACTTWSFVTYILIYFSFGVWWLCLFLSSFFFKPFWTLASGSKTSVSIRNFGAFVGVKQVLHPMRLIPTQISVSRMQFHMHDGLHTYLHRIFGMHKGC